MGYHSIIARCVAKWGIAQMRLCEVKYQGWVSHQFGALPLSFKKYRAMCGIAAIVSQYPIWSGPFPPLSTVNPVHEGHSVSGAAFFFNLVSLDPAC